MADSFEGVLANIPFMGGVYAARKAAEESQNNQLRQTVGNLGLLAQIQAQQQAAQLRNALANGDTTTIAKLPGGIDILNKMATIQNTGITGQLHSAQLQDIQRKAAVANEEQAYRRALINQVTQSQYKGDAPAATTPQVVSIDERAADQMAMDALKQNEERKAQGLPEIPFTLDNNNPNVTKGLAIGAGSSLPRSAQAALLNPGVAGNGQTIAPRQVQDSSSPTGWSWMNPKDGTRTVGAPAPSSVARATAANAGDAGVGMMTPETLKFTAQQVIAGDRQASQGYARSAPMRAALQNAIAEEAKAQGLSGKDLARIMSEFVGFTAGQRALGTREANIQLAAQVANQFAPLAITASEAFDRTPFKSLNDIEKAVLSRTASPELRRFNAANMSLINAYARAVSPTGIPAQAEKEHAREILDTGFSKGDYKAAVEQLELEIKAELAAPGAVKAGMKDYFEGKAAPASTVTAPVREFATEADAIKSGVKGQVKINGRNARID